MVAKALTRKGTALAKCSSGKDFFKHPDDGAANRDLEVHSRPSLEAKLIELVHNICLQEIMLCSAAAKEFVKLLKGETGGDLLRLYLNKSPEFAELLAAWNDRKQGLSYIFKLITTILSHAEGKGRSTAIGIAIDGFAMLLIRQKLDEINKALKSNEGKQQNAALLLLASIVRRGPRMASQVFEKFDFKGFAKLKLGEYSTLTKHPTRRRKAFVAFAISFLEVGKPKLLGYVLQQKEMYSKVLRGLGNDSEDTVVSVLSALKDKILVKESSIPPRLRSVLFGSATLEQLASISARKDAGTDKDLAHDVLLQVCTDPCNGLMPDANRNLRGNSGRLLLLMKRLRAIDSCYHLDLLLAIVRGRPSFASALLDDFPYNVEDLASPSWFYSVSLAADLVSSVRSSSSFDFLNPDQPPSAGSDVQTIMNCICPRPFSRSLITKGMLHSDFLVRHGTLRFLLETLRLLDSFLTACKLCSSHSCSAEQIQERDIMGEVRSFFPDSQVLLTLLKSLGGTQKLSLKRKAVLDSHLVDRKKRIHKRSDKDLLDEEAVDIVIGRVTSFLAEDPVDQADAERKCLGIVSENWGSKRIDSVEEAEMCFHTKLLEVLRIYLRSVPNGLEGSFDFFMKLLSTSFGLPAEFQRALLSLLNECISWAPNSRVPTKIPPLMFKHLHVLMNLLLFSPHEGVKDLAYDLALVAMRSTGAFDKNPSEIGAWFRFLPGFDKIKRPLKVQEALQRMPSVVISFVCQAVSTVGNNLFKQWEIVRSSLSHFKGVSIGFSPLIVCILHKCVRVLNSESKTYSLPEKSEISLYVCSTLKYLLQTQVDSRPLSCLVQSVLSEVVVDGSKDSLCEWRPLRMLLLFSQSLSDKKPFILGTAGLLAADTCFADTLDEIKGLVRSISPDQDEFAGIVKAFSCALICATPESILKNFASVMAVSWDLYGTTLSFLQSISFLDENLLGNLLKLSPDLCSQVFTGSRNLTVDGEIDFADHSSSIKSKTALFLEQMPFPALLNAVMRMDLSCLLELPRISELLLLKVSQPRSDSVESDIQLTLNWLSQIRSFYKVQPAPVLCQLSEMCSRLVKHSLSQISEQDLVSGSSSSDKLLEIVLCHPVMMAVLKSPLDCGTVQNVSETSGRLVISEIDQHILDLLVSTCEHFLFDERHIRDLRANKSMMAIKDLVERLLLVFRRKFKRCVGSQSYTPLLQPSQLIHALLRFISPFKLLHIAHSMLSKIDEEGLASRPNSSVILSFGLDTAGGAFEMLMLYPHQPAAKRGVYDLLWDLEEKNYDRNLIGQVYGLACRFFTSLGWVSAETCLLKLVGGGIFRGVHPLAMIISQIVERTPQDVIIHCINQANMTRGKILFYLVESSPLHLSVLGQFFSSKQQDEFGLTDDQLIMLLPAVLSYMESVIAKLDKPCSSSSSRCLDITSVYSNILINGFPKFLSSGCIFEEKYDEILVSSEDIETMFNASLVGKAVRMFQYHFALTESPTKTDHLLKVFDSMFPHTTSADDMLDYELKEVDVESVDKMFIVAIRVVARVTLSRICLFPEDSSLCREAGSCVKLLLNALVNSWQCVVEKSDEGNSQGKCWSLCKSLENFILTSILKFLQDMCEEELLHLDPFPFLHRLMKSILKYRFKDSKTLKILREIFLLLSRGKYSYAPYIQLLIAHPQFTPTISSLSRTGELVLFRPVLSSILKHLIISSPNSVGGVGTSYELEIVKILRVLLSKDSGGIDLKKLHFDLLCCYGATLSEIDLELYKLMHDIELIDDESRLNVFETDYLWGKADLELYKLSDGGEDVRRSLFKENLRVDPKICALTVLYFPYQHTAEVSDDLFDDPISSEKCYNPAFILRFSEHSLYTGYIEPLEFASLGLLAVAFVSMSSADLGMRKLANETLGKFVQALNKCCTMNKHVKYRLGLLLSYVQNGVEEQWQRIPTVCAVFAAETSLILLDSSHEHCRLITKYLKRSSTLKLRGIPMFHDFFWSSTVNLKSERHWGLGLVLVGLKSEEDAQMYMRNSILETLMRFSSCPLADDETKGLILEVVRKSVKFHKMARHLVEKCGLFSWCSSFIPTKPIGDGDSIVLVLEVITDALASRNVTEWLQRFALEGLSEISSRLYRLVILGGGTGGLVSNGSTCCVDLVLQILSATLKISQKRKVYQPHFTITVEGILGLFDSRQCAERALDTILMSTPPIDIICMDVDKLTRFLLWGTSTALKIDGSKSKAKPSEEETMVAKFLRWLLASVILGKLYYSQAWDPIKPEETLLTLLQEYSKKRNLGGLTKSEHVIGEVILHLQKLVCTNSNYYWLLLPSVVFSLSLMLLRNGLGTAGDDIKSLSCRITSPPEAIPAWRWSYYHDLSSEPATDLEKMDLLHACQELLPIFSDMLGCESQLRQSFDMSSVFEWERGLVDTS